MIKLRCWQCAAFFLLLASLLLQACDSCTPSVTIKSWDIVPSRLATGVSGRAVSQGFCTSAGSTPPTAFSAGTGQVMAGYDDFFREGSFPFPCDDLRSVTFRGGMQFDLSRIDKIASAELLFDVQSAVDRGNDGFVSSTPIKSFATTLGVVTAWSSTLPDTNEVSLQNAPKFKVLVTNQVNDWLSKTQANLGFVVWGPRGPVGEDLPEDNDAQISWYGNIRLRVFYNPAFNPRAPQ